MHKQTVLHPRYSRWPAARDYESSSQIGSSPRAPRGEPATCGVSGSKAPSWPGGELIAAIANGSLRANGLPSGAGDIERHQKRRLTDDDEAAAPVATNQQDQDDEWPTAAGRCEPLAMTTKQKWMPNEEALARLVGVAARKRRRRRRRRRPSIMVAVSIVLCWLAVVIPIAHANTSAGGRVRQVSEAAHRGLRVAEERHSSQRLGHASSSTEHEGAAASDTRQQQQLNQRPREHYTDGDGDDKQASDSGVGEPLHPSPGCSADDEDIGNKLVIGRDRNATATSVGEQDENADDDYNDYGAYVLYPQQVSEDDGDGADDNNNLSPGRGPANASIAADELTGASIDSAPPSPFQVIFFAASQGRRRAPAAHQVDLPASEFHLSTRATGDNNNNNKRMRRMKDDAKWSSAVNELSWQQADSANNDRNSPGRPANQSDDNEMMTTTTTTARQSNDAATRDGTRRNSTSADGSSQEEGGSDHTVYYWRLIWFVLPVGATFGNLLVIMAVYRERTLQSVTNYFIVSLAFSDLFVGLIVMPFAVYVLVNGVWELSDTICDIYVAVDVTSSTASILNLVAISIDRYRAVAYPIAYTASSSSTIAILTICGVWLISCAVGAPIIFGLNTTPGRKSSLCILYNSTFIFWSSLASFYIPCIAMTLLYWRIFSAIRSRTKKAIQGHQQVITVNNNNNNKRQVIGAAEKSPGCASVDTANSQPKSPVQQLPTAPQTGDNTGAAAAAASQNQPTDSACPLANDDRIIKLDEDLARLLTLKSAADKGDQSSSSSIAAVQRVGRCRCPSTGAEWAQTSQSHCLARFLSLLSTYRQASTDHSQKDDHHSALAACLTLSVAPEQLTSSLSSRPISTNDNDESRCGRIFMEIESRYLGASNQAAPLVLLLKVVRHQVAGSDTRRAQNDQVNPSDSNTSAHLLQLLKDKLSSLTQSRPLEFVLAGSECRRAKSDKEDQPVPADCCDTTCSTASCCCCQRRARCSCCGRSTPDAANGDYSVIDKLLTSNHFAICILETIVGEEVALATVLCLPGSLVAKHLIACKPKPCSGQLLVLLPTRPESESDNNNVECRRVVAGAGTNELLALCNDCRSFCSIGIAFQLDSVSGALPAQMPSKQPVANQNLAENCENLTRLIKEEHHQQNKHKTDINKLALLKASLVDIEARGCSCSDVSDCYLHHHHPSQSQSGSGSSSSSASTNFRLGDRSVSESSNSSMTPEFECSAMDKDTRNHPCCRRPSSSCATCDASNVESYPTIAALAPGGDGRSCGCARGASMSRPPEVVVADKTDFARQLELESVVASGAPASSQQALQTQIIAWHDQESKEAEPKVEPPTVKIKEPTSLFQSTTQTIKRRSMRLNQLIRGRRSSNKLASEKPAKLVKNAMTKQGSISDGNGHVDQVRTGASKKFTGFGRGHYVSRSITGGAKPSDTVQSPVEGLKSFELVNDTTSYGESEMFSRIDSSTTGVGFGGYRNLSAPKLPSNFEAKSAKELGSKQQYLWTPSTELATTVDPSSSSSGFHKPGPSYLVSTVVNLMQRMPSSDEPGDKQKRLAPAVGSANATASKGDTLTSMLANNRQHRPGSRRKREKNAARRERKATKTLAIVLGVFLICWTPFFTCNIIDGICIQLDMDCRPGMMVYLVTSWLGYINSCVNPIIYTIFNMEFRRAFKKILTTSPRCCADG